MGFGSEVNLPASLDGIVSSDRPLQQNDRTITVGAASVMVLGQNPLRVWASLVNDGDNVIYLQLGAVAISNTGIRLNPAGGSLTIDRNMPWTGQVHAIAPGGNTVLCGQEVSVQER